MNLGKIYRYELKRLLFNKFFIGILAVTLFYAYQVLTLEVVRGISHTAPFSAWSFGYYLARVLPLVCIGELFFLTFFVSKAEKRVAVLTNATPVNERRYLLTRSLAALTGTALLAGAVLVLGVLFLYRLFGPQAYGALVLPAVLVLLPAILFCMGLGWLLGRAHPAGVYGAMVLALLLSVAPLPIEAGFSLSAFFAKMPLSTSMLDPAFAAPPAMLLMRLCYLLLGLGALLWCCRGTEVGGSLRSQ